MKLSNAVKYRYHKLLKATGVYYVLVATVFIVGVIASLVYKKDFNSNMQYLAVFSTYLFYLGGALAFFFGICSYKTEMKFFLQNGVSRRNIHLSFIASLFVNVVTLAVTVALNALFGKIAYGCLDGDLNLKTILTALLTYITLMSIGYFISSFVFSVKPINQIITAGVIAFIVLLFVLIWHVKLGGSLVVVYLAVCSFLFGSLTGFIHYGHLVAALMCVIAFSLSLAHIITLKAVVKK